MEDKILTKHPEGKSGVSISKEKYDLVRALIIENLQVSGELTYTQLADLLKNELRGKFDGSIPWYVEVVKLDLEARRILARIPRTKPQLYRLTVKDG